MVLTIATKFRWPIIKKLTWNNSSRNSRTVRSWQKERKLSKKHQNQQFKKLYKNKLEDQWPKKEYQEKNSQKPLKYGSQKSTSVEKSAKKIFYSLNCVLLYLPRRKHTSHLNCLKQQPLLVSSDNVLLEKWIIIFPGRSNALVWSFGC